MGSWYWCSIETACFCMSLVFSASPAAILSLLIDNMENTNGDANGKQDFDTLQLRNRTVTETLSEVKDLGQSKKGDEKNGSSEDDKKGDEEADADKFDKLELRNRTVTETLSLVSDLGQDAPEKKEEEKYDKLELRNRTVTETESLVSDFGKNQKNDDNEEPEAKKKKFDTLSLRNRDVTETLSPLEN